MGAGAVVGAAGACSLAGCSDLVSVVVGVLSGVVVAGLGGL